MNLISRFTALLLGVARTLWRLAWLLLGLGLVIGLVVMGALVWLIARLLGKKPAPVKVRWGAMNPPPFGRRAARPADDTEVVDVQAREIGGERQASPPPAEAPSLPGPRRDA